MNRRLLLRACSSNNNSQWHRWLALAAVVYLFQHEIHVGVLNIDNLIGVKVDDVSDLPRTPAAFQQPKNNATDIPFDPIQSFHIPAYNRIQQLINEDNIISWGYKKAPGFPEELRIKSVLTPGLFISRLHELSLEEKLAIWSNRTQHPAILWEPRICDAIQHFRETQQVQPHVLFTRCNENVGEFSRYVPENKTANWDDAVDWVRNGCKSNQEVWEYLKSRHTLAVFTMQHQFVEHPKVHSLPLGIKQTMKVQVLKLLQEPRVSKTKWLMINDNGWKHRKQVTDTVIENFAKFNMTLSNAYDNKKSSNYLKELRRSKFILAPSGLGWDCYRIWEALHFNTIPIIERFHRPHDGWRRTLDGLPVLWVEDLSEVTPKLLRDEYRRIASQGPQHYQYEKLTRQWWIQFVKSKVSIEEKSY